MNTPCVSAQCSIVHPFNGTGLLVRRRQIRGDGCHCIAEPPLLNNFTSLQSFCERIFVPVLGIAKGHFYITVQVKRKPNNFLFSCSICASLFLPVIPPKLIGLFQPVAIISVY
jgi:hypothetical protein